MDIGFLLPITCFRVAFFGTHEIQVTGVGTPDTATLLATVSSSKSPSEFGCGWAITSISAILMLLISSPALVKVMLSPVIAWGVAWFEVPRDEIPIVTGDAQKVLHLRLSYRNFLVAQLGNGFPIGFFLSAETTLPTYLISKFIKSHLTIFILKPASRKHSKTSRICGIGS